MRWAAIAVSIILLGTVTLASRLPDEPSRPNIIVVLTDDQRFDALGFIDSKLDTPNMDRIAREGIWFPNAFVTTSLCSPSRASLLTGLPMRQHGVIDNNSKLPTDLDTFPISLKRSGYSTGLFGKWHMGGEDASPRPGFDRWVSFPGQGNYGPKSMLGGASLLNIDGETVPQKGYITDELTDYAIEWLDQRSEDKPFLLYLSHKAVHAPFVPAERYANQYQDMEIKDETPSAAQMLNEPMWVQNQRNSWHGTDYPYHSQLSLPSYKREYLKTLTAVDDSLGRILNWLEEEGQSQNTILIFLSDNGFMFGEHGLIDKRTAHEESIRIPMIFWAPGRIKPGQVEPSSVSMLDITPTIVSAASAEMNTPLPGRDLSPFFIGAKPSNWSNETIYEYFWEFNYPHTPTQFAIRTERYKYVRLHGVWDTDALYDLQKDPSEQNNLINDPEYLQIRIDLQNRLHARIQGRDGRGHISFSKKFNQGAVFRNPNGTRSANFPQIWLRPDYDPERFEHILPDSPSKAQMLPVINEALGHIPDRGKDQDMQQ